MSLYFNLGNNLSSHRDMTPLQIRFIRSSWLLVNIQTGILPEERDEELDGGSEGKPMKKNTHNTFIENLYKQIHSIEEHRDDSSKSDNGDSSQKTGEIDIISELEKKFDELFGSLNDDDG